MSKFRQLKKVKKYMLMPVLYNISEKFFVILSLNVMQILNINSRNFQRD